MIAGLGGFFVGAVIRVVIEVGRPQGSAGP